MTSSAPDVELVPAGSLSLAELTALFNTGYRGYLVPLVFDEATMRRHLEDNDIDLGLSRVAVVGEPAAIALIGRRGGEAWVGGLGTAPAGRRRGFGALTLRAGIEAAAAEGASRVRLEVLVDNAPAIALYGKLGFAATRRVMIWTLRDLGEPQIAWRPVALDDAHAWIVEHRAGPEPWQRDDAVVRRARTGPRGLAAFAVGDPGAISAAVICAAEPSSTRVVQIAGRDAASAMEALRAVATAVDDRPVRLSNIPDSDPVAAAVSGLGVAPDHVQFEMTLAVGDGVLSGQARPGRPGPDQRGRLS